MQLFTFYLLPMRSYTIVGNIETEHLAYTLTNYQNIIACNAWYELIACSFDFSIYTVS